MTEERRNGYEANYIVQGDGQPMILVHGIAASLHGWQLLTPELAAAGYRTYALDLLGHGDSPKPENVEEYHVESIYTHFVEWIDTLALEMPPLLVGHSLGGLLSLLYAQRQPDRVRGLVLIDPFLNPGQLSPFLHVIRRQPTLGEKALRMAPEQFIYTLACLERTNASKFPDEMCRQIASDYKRASPYIVHIMQTVPNITPLLAEVTTPTLLIWGKNDLTLNPRSFLKLARKLPNVVCHPIPGCGHQPHIGEAEAVKRLILDFMGGLKA